MAQRIGIYLCECGTNISDGIDLAELESSVARWPDIALVRRHRLLCSEEGCAQIGSEIREHELSRVPARPRSTSVPFAGLAKAAGSTPTSCT
jgi:heterodisulfide reductase subunit A